MADSAAVEEMWFLLENSREAHAQLRPQRNYLVNNVTKEDTQKQEENRRAKPPKPKEDSDSSTE